MSEDAVLHLRMSNISYKAPGKRIGGKTGSIGHFLEKEGWEDVTTEHVEGEDVVLRMAVLKRGDQAIVSFRGTHDLKDVVSDFYIACSIVESSSRFVNSSKLVGQVLKSKKYKNVTVTGHSLGGTIAWFCAREHELKGHVFNCGADLGNFIKGLFFEYTFNLLKGKIEIEWADVVHHHIYGDVISAGTSCLSVRETLIYDVNSCDLLYVHKLDAFIVALNRGIIIPKKVKVNKLQQTVL